MMNYDTTFKVMYGTDGCRIRKCKSCGTYNISAKVDSSCEVENGEIKHYYECSECGRKYKARLVTYENSKPHGKLIVNFTDFNPSRFEVSYKGKREGAIFLDEERVAVVTFKKVVIKHPSKLRIYEGEDVRAQDYMQKNFVGLEEIFKNHMKLSLKKCPECGKVCICRGITNATELTAKNRYRCECGNKFWEYRYFWNRNSKGEKVNAHLREILKIQSLKSNKIFFAIQEGLKYLVIIDNEFKSIPLDKATVIGTSRR